RRWDHSTPLNTIGWWNMVSGFAGMPVRSGKDRPSLSPIGSYTTAASGPSATLLLELPGVVLPPELRRRPGFRINGTNADSMEALHVAEDIQALGNVLGGQADVGQLHSLQGSQVGDGTTGNRQEPERHSFERRQVPDRSSCYTQRGEEHSLERPK